MADVFLLKIQRDNRKKALAVYPAEGKTGKKLYFSPYCGDETTTYYNRAIANQQHVSIIDLSEKS